MNNVAVTSNVPDGPTSHARIHPCHVKVKQHVLYLKLAVSKNRIYCFNILAVMDIGGFIYMVILDMGGSTVFLKPNYFEIFFYCIKVHMMNIIISFKCAN